MKKKKWIIRCSHCGEDVEIIKHVNKCECGARIKILDFHGEEKE